MDDFKVKNQVFDAKRSYKEILKNSDDIKQIAKNTGLDTEDVKKVKDYLFKEKHLMPDGTYRQFDASEEVADAWKRLTNGKATDDDILLFNHELTELRFVEEGFSVDAAHILSSVDYNWSSVSKIDDFARKCSEIYGKDFYFGAGTSNEAIDAIVKQIDNLDGQVDDVIEVGLNPQTTIDYSYKFDRELVNFNDGYEVKTIIEKDLILVQYSSDAPDASLCYWTTIDEANEISTLDEYMDKLALSKDWGNRNTVKVSRIPAGTKVKHAVGTAREQMLLADPRPGGGVQYLFNQFDTSWITEIRSF